jgi:hypothetical protein
LKIIVANKQKPDLIAYVMTNKTPDQWAAEIAALPLEITLKRAAARIIWWDHFADRNTTERWNHLDQWLGYDGAEYDDFVLRMALVQLGYTEAEAAKRVK